MGPVRLRRLDALSRTLLLLWVGMALGFALLSAPALFRLLPSRELAATVAGVLVERLDWMAFGAFGLALLLSQGLRWLQEIQDADPIGPLRLWTGAALAALLLTGLSAGILTPRIREVRAAHQNSVSSLPAEHPDRAVLDRSHRLSTQVFSLRILLALALAWGVGQLPVAERRED